MSFFSLFNKQYLPLRDWQDVAYSTLSNKQYGMLNAPPGAGKSFGRIFRSCGITIILRCILLGVTGVVTRKK